MVPQCSAVLGGMFPFLVVLAVKALVAPQRVSTHSAWPSKIWLAFYLLQNLMYWFAEYSIDCLRSCKPRLPSKIPPRSVIVVTIRPKIPPLLRDNLTFSLALLLVLLNPFVLINPIHELAYTGERFPNQRLPQSMLGR